MEISYIFNFQKYGEINNSNQTTTRPDNGGGGQFTWSAFTIHKDEKDLCQNKENYVKAVNERHAILGHRVRNQPLVGILPILVVLPCYTTC